jgi:hypothetical protein
VASLALIVGAVVVGGVIVRAYPRDVSLRYDLGPRHAEVVEAHLRYRGGSEELAGLTLREPGGLPERFFHEVELAPGRYEVTARLVGGDGADRQVVRAFDVPAGDVVRIDLTEAGR